MFEQQDLLRIATMNILNSPHVFQERMEAITDQLSDLQPSIVSFQEAIFSYSQEPVKTLEQTAERLDMNLVVGAEPLQHPRKEVTYANAFLVAHDIKVLDCNPILPEGMTNRATLQSLTQLDLEARGRRITIFNGHFPWGGANELSRLTFAKEVSIRAGKLLEEHPEALIYLNGDLNAEPDSDTLRYLTGKHVFNEHSTFWADAWSMFNDSTVDGHTSRNDGLEAVETAHGVGITYPHLIPRRRIDYILAYGWIYGRIGTPVNIERFGFGTTHSGRSLSDHYGLYTDLWVPEV